MEYLNSEDYLNNNGVRNIDNTEYKDYNCGGYALKTFSWYHPYKFFAWEYIEKLLDDGYDCNEIVDRILQLSCDNMLEDFGSKIRLIDYTDHDRGDAIEKKLLAQLHTNEELIAFRIGLEIDDTRMYEDEAVVEDYDFHYRVYRNGCWQEKIGNGMIGYCDFTEDIWDGYCTYDSPIYYFAMKVA